ncbi:MAG: hypothetical protein EOO38_32785, partial [Cytophagaceae bacterium]
MGKTPRTSSVSAYVTRMNYSMSKRMWHLAMFIQHAFSSMKLVPVLAGLIAVAPAVAMAANSTTTMPKTTRIDRHALVTRHNVVLTKFDGERPLQVGNGEFAFGMDISGLQSFAPFNTMSQWGWHEAPLPAGKKIEDYHMQPVRMHGRDVLMPMPDPKEPELSNWMRG